MNEIESLREEMRSEERRHQQKLEEFERRLVGVEKVTEKVLRFVQGDAEFNQKGLVSQIADMVAFVELMKGMNLGEMKIFLDEIKDFKKRALAIAGFLISVGTFLWLIIMNIDKILKAFGK